MSWIADLKTRYLAAAAPLRTERRVELALLLLTMLVLLQLLWFLVARLSSPSIDPLPPAADSIRVGALATDESISAADSLRLQTRPLFWPDRRPVAEVSAAPEEPTGEGPAPARSLKNLELTGVFGGGDSGGAIVSYKGERQRLLVGDELDGWTLLSVSPDEVVFTSAGTRDARRLNPVPVRADAITLAPAEPSASAAPAPEPEKADAAQARPPRARIKTPTNKPPAGGSLTLGGPGAQ